MPPSARAKVVVPVPSPLTAPPSSPQRRTRPRCRRGPRLRLAVTIGPAHAQVEQVAPAQRRGPARPTRTSTRRRARPRSPRRGRRASLPPPRRWSPRPRAAAAAHRRPTRRTLVAPCAPSPDAVVRVEPVPLHVRVARRRAQVAVHVDAALRRSPPARRSSPRCVSPVHPGDVHALAQEQPVAAAPLRRPAAARPRAPPIAARRPAPTRRARRRPRAPDRAGSGRAAAPPSPRRSAPRAAHPGTDRTRAAPAPPAHADGNAPQLQLVARQVERRLVDVHVPGDHQRPVADVEAHLVGAEGDGNRGRRRSRPGRPRCCCCCASASLAAKERDGERRY